MTDLYSRKWVIGVRDQGGRLLGFADTNYSQICRGIFELRVDHHTADPYPADKWTQVLMNRAIRHDPCLGRFIYVFSDEMRILRAYSGFREICG